MADLVYTSIYASLLALIYIGLAAFVIKLRFQYKVGIGDGGNENLAKAIRVHGNFSEYVPITLILLLVFELNHADKVWLHIFGIMLVVARLLHAFGLSKSIGTTYQRIAGTVMNVTIIFLLSLANIMLIFLQHYY